MRVCVKLFQSFCITLHSYHKYEFQLLHFFHILTSTWHYHMFLKILPIGCVVIAHCGFNLQCPNGIWVWTSFHMLICHLNIFFGAVSVQIFCPPLLIRLFFFLLLSVQTSLYILFFIYVFIYDCVGSSFLCEGFL